MDEVRLTPDLRRRLKKPLGEVVTGRVEEVRRRLRERWKESPPRVIAVGDAVSRFTSQHGIPVDVRIIDYREMRGRAPPHPMKARYAFTLKNPAGTISSKAWRVVSQAISQGDSLISVEGEEDLLALVAVREAPPGSLVLYGQPHQGIVVIEVNEAKKREVQDMLDSMRRVDDHPSSTNSV